MIIALGHRKQVGKDTLANLICRNSLATDLGFIEKCSFAQPLYDMAERYFFDDGFRNKDYYDQFPLEKEIPLKKLNLTPRQILISLGQSMRAISPTFWIDQVPLDRNIVIPDLRFPNEVEFVKKHGGIVIKVERPGIEDSNDLADSALADYTGWDYVVQNTGLDELDKISKAILIMATIEEKLNGSS